MGVGGRAGALYRRSIEIIREHQAPSGAYPASPTFSQYGYVWLRDGSFTAHAMDRAGEHESAARFFAFVDRVIRQYRSKIESVVRKAAVGEAIAEQEYCHTRFTLDGSEGVEDWWNHQLDGYGTWLWALARHVELTGDRQLLGKYADSIRMTVAYLCTLWRQPNYDCWEEFRDRVHPATLACIYGGLRCIGELTNNIAAVAAATEIQRFVRTQAVVDGHLVKYLGTDAVDASLMWVAVPFGLLPLGDPVMQATIARIEQDLSHGGVHRYLDDTFYGGGEWVLLTAWLGWIHALDGNRKKAVACRDWVEAQSLGDGSLPEQVADRALFPDMIQPWIKRWGPSAKLLLWSHAMYVLLCTELNERSHRGQLTSREAASIEHWPSPREGYYPTTWPERFPDRPEAHQEVRVGVHTSPPGAASHVYATCGGADIKGGWEYTDGEKDVWLIRLPGAPAGSHVEYALCADDTRAGPFAYDVANWQPARETTDTATIAPLEVEDISWDLGRDGEPVRMRWQFKSPPDEAFYGLGERFNALDQRGNCLDVHVYEEYKQQGRRTYLPIPFLLSSRGYAVVVHSSRYAAFDLSADAKNPDVWSMTLDAPGAQWSVLRGETPEAILRQYADLVGHASVPPDWTFGPWMSSNDWNSQARVEHELAKTQALNIPATVLVLEAWSDEATFYIWNDARYANARGDWQPRLSDFEFPPSGRWPDPKRLVDAIHDKGMRILLWQVPVQKADGPPHIQRQVDETYMLERGYMVREADGSGYRHRGWWFPGSLVLDVTSPEGTEWWLSKRAYLLDELGIDGFKTDGGEHIWGRDLRFADGTTSAETCNRYPVLYESAYYNFARRHRGGDAVTFSRAGFVAAQAAPCHWAGDEDSTWAAFRHSILAGLNAGLSGIPFWSFDLAGFSGEIPSAELYLRAAAVATFCPIMQYHSEYRPDGVPNRDRTPWNIAERTGDPRVVEIYRKFAHLRMRLTGYISTQAKRTAQSGMPLMRAMPLAFPHCQDANEFTYQYLFGDDVLVCPVVRPGVTELEVYLPEGEWRDAWTGTTIKGGRRCTYPAPIDQPPVFVRGPLTSPL